MCDIQVRRVSAKAPLRWWVAGAGARLSAKSELPISGIRARPRIGGGQHRTSIGTVLTSTHLPIDTSDASEEFRECFVDDVCCDGGDQFRADDIAGSGDLLVRMAE